MFEGSMLEGRCGYFDDRNSVEFFIPLPDEGGDGDEKYSGGLPSLFDSLLSDGFRRSGKFVYNAVCPGCKQCVPIRIPVRKFAFSKNQRHLLRRNSDIEMRVVTGAEDMITMEKADLFSRYMERHEKTEPFSRSKSLEVLFDMNGIEKFEKPFYPGTVNFDYRLDGKLVGVGIIDLGRTSLSSCYFYYDISADMMRRSLGTYSILKEIEYCAASGYDFYYLGYYISKCRAMSYKGRFLPHELLIDGVWKEQCEQNWDV